MKIRTKTKSMVAVATIVLLILVAVFGIFATQTSTFQASAQTLEIDGQASLSGVSAREAYSDDNFTLDKINVVLTKEASRQFRNYAPNDFLGIGVKEVSDLTQFTVDYVRDEFELRNSRSTFRTLNNVEMQVDVDEFQRILSLTIDHSSREKVFETIDILNQREDVYIAEPDILVSNTSAPAFTANWLTDMRNLIGWDALESFQANAPEIIVGVIDTGIESIHTQLNGRMHRGNPHNATTTWHRDFSTGVAAGNAVVEPTDPQENAAGTIVGHGTQVAGIISALHWNARFVSLQVFPADPATTAPTTGGISVIARAINYAQSRNIPILNYSGTGYGTTASIATALNSYTGLFVASAGNNGQNRDNDTQWANAATQARIMVVGAHNHIGGRSVWNADTRRVHPTTGAVLHQSSSYGANRVHIYAPGAGAGSIWTPSPTGTSFRDFSGTSAAAPFVAGTAALIRSLRPDMNFADIRTLIINNGIDENIMVPVWDAAGNNITGHVAATVRRLSAHRAVVNAFVEPTSATGDATIRMRTGINLPQGTNLIISDFINRQRVVGITASGFSGQTKLSQITIPASVNNIGTSAFSGCNADLSVTWTYNPSLSASSINSFITYLKTIDVPAGITAVNIPHGMTAIDSETLSGAVGNLTEINIPASVTRIDGWAFDNCNSLKNITVNSKNQYYSAQNGILYNKYKTELIYVPRAVSGSITLAGSLTSIPAAAFTDRAGLISVTIPANVTSIGNNAFTGCTGLMSITIPTNVTNIGNGAFSDCYNLQSVKFGQNSKLQSIGVSAFSNCGELAGITIPEGTTSIGSGAFMYCSKLEQVSIPKSMTSIGDSAFIGCYNLSITWYYNPLLTVSDLSSAYFNFGSYLKTVIIPSGVTSIKAEAFKNCSGLTEITIPSWVTSIGEDAFAGTGIWGYGGTGIVYADKWAVGYRGTLSGGNTMRSDTVGIAASAFKNCNNLTFTIPASVKYVGSSAFSGSTNLSIIWDYNPALTAANFSEYLTTVNIASGVTGIGAYSFNNCAGLTFITIPDSVTSIGSYAFNNCTNLTNIGFGQNSRLSTVGNNSFMGTAWYNSKPNGLVYAGKVLYKYKGTMPANTIINNIAQNTTGIADYAFYGCSNLKGITVPNNVTVIGEQAFAYCSNLTSINIPDNVTVIGGHAFADCAGLANVSMSEYGSLTSIGEYAFYSCGNLTELTIPNSVVSIGFAALEGCRSLERLTIPFVGHTLDGTSSTNFIYIFGSWDYRFPIAPETLTTVVITGGYSIAAHAFENCSYIESITLPDGITNIETGAFWECVALAEIIIPGSVTNIGQSAFYGCSSLRSITLPNRITGISNYAFYGCGITSITVPAGVTSIGNYSFSGLGTVYIQRSCSAGITTLGTNALGTYSNIKIYVPDMASVAAYKNAASWSTYQLKIAWQGVPPHLSDYDYYEIDACFGIYNTVYTNTAFVINSPNGGTYELYIEMYIYYYDVNIRIYDASSAVLNLVYEFEDNDSYGVVTETIELDAGVPYLVEVCSASGGSFVFELSII